MISEGSCDTEDCNDAGFRVAITGVNYVFKYTKKEKKHFKLIIFYNITFFYQINAALVKIVH